MRWNPFRRTDPSEAPDSQFESTVVDDARLAALGGSAAAAGAPGADAGRRASAPVAGTLGEGANIGHIGRYALKTVLGEGGLGTVYAAWDPLLSRTVAVKTLHLDADPAARDSLDALFLNEARAAAGLSHPHIVTVFDAGPAETGVYIAMERLQGQDLRRLLADGFRPTPIEAAQIVRRVADALAYAHRKGVIHCDIKPANIFMVGRLHPKVLDFGIARVAHREATPTLDGVMAGSPFYLPPEQLDGAAVDRRSDVYSLGVVLYELLTGRRPYDGRTLEEISKAVHAGDAPPAQRVAPRVPLGLSVIAGRAMARRAEERYPSARHLAMELRHWTESAEARGLSDPSQAEREALSLGQRLVRLALPTALLSAVGALLWMTLAPPTPEPAPVAARAAPPVLDRLAARRGAPVAAAAPVAAVPSPAAPTDTPPALPTATAPGPVAAAPAAIPLPSNAPLPTAGPWPAAKPPIDARRKPGRVATVVAAEATPPPPAPSPSGVVQLAIIPWGQVEVDGQAMGISPPLTRLSLAAGAHTITVRNADFPAYVSAVTVDAERPLTLRHRFGP